MVFGEVMAIMGASDKIVELMAYKTDINTTGGEVIPESEVNGLIQIENVKFNYPSKKEVPVLKGVTISVDN